jgi:hypothetical protein
MLDHYYHALSQLCSQFLSTSRKMILLIRQFTLKIVLHRFKKVAKWLIKKMIRAVLGNKTLKKCVLLLLGCFPGLRSYAYKLAFKANFSTPSSAPATTTKELSPLVESIYLQLKAVVEAKKH